LNDGGSSLDLKSRVWSADSYTTVAARTATTRSGSLWRSSHQININFLIL
jgi:hypothetical protein